MTISMTGFASRKGQAHGFAWVWDIRSVNGKGLDLRLRLPDWVDGLELAIRAELQKALGRGNVNLTLKVTRDAAEGEAGLQVNQAALMAVLQALRRVEDVAMGAGVTLGQPTAADVLGVRGVLETASGEEDTAPLRAALLADLPALLDDFAQMRATEGAALNGVITAQLAEISALTAAAKVQADARRDAGATQLREALAKVLQNADGVDEARLSQELAMIAVKNDVTEELDRLAAHVDAAAALLQDTGPIGRKFDFLMQEFMREANTLCSKAQALHLTRIGLDLKTVIDQMREQVQNVE
ncbi:MAG: YicC family protein [Rhodobacteraceae bacterium]|nr:YicC family protein [Paracoccaceae bacterium]MCF8513985.1 YicC family protein [Paracoccaceae bacterium]MCF8518229.1 YicC family protein [Paracoccaceae bacterium]